MLNAKYHESEAEIVAQAGRYGAVTIATNMAGRGTDILLGGNPEFMASRSASSRDRAAVAAKSAARWKPARRRDVTYCYYQGTEFEAPLRQWNEASSATRSKPTRSTTRSSSSAACSFSAPSGTRRGASTTSCAAAPDARAIPAPRASTCRCEDDLMRIFAEEWVSTLLQRLGMEEGVPIESRMVTRRIEAAQKAVEGQNFEARKHLLEYDDVMNKQREAVYGLRRQLLEGIGPEGPDPAKTTSPAFSSELLDKLRRRKTSTRRLGPEGPEERRSSPASAWIFSPKASKPER